MGNNAANKDTRLSRYLKAPIRILIKIREFYVQGMTELSGRFEYGTAMGCPTPQIATLPKSFSTNSSRSSNNNEDFRELMRAASTRGLGNKVQADLLRRQQAVGNSPATHASSAPGNVFRSRSVAFGRIDEDEPCDFEEDIKVNADVYPRSRSHAVARRSRVF
ncbi:uncharacterized protein LOC121244987 [Juglans microcarpa x Juglans regia]|uniref:uncharacterized protein LOC121244987 n=1 Tax=Juglans microcarpa x Juglans regia TaxID=2249226 RepID=UPI001B7E7B10|nr:uncharacterized protein LOC121244987 [Juglans microcarpa x Juglans regia]